MSHSICVSLANLKVRAFQRRGHRLPLRKLIILLKSGRNPKSSLFHRRSPIFRTDAAGTVLVPEEVTTPGEDEDEDEDVLCGRQGVGAARPTQGRDENEGRHDDEEEE